jgi:hypothetical protein
MRHKGKSFEVQSFQVLWDAHGQGLFPFAKAAAIAGKPAKLRVAAGG